MMIPHFVNRKDISTNGSASKRALNLVPFLHVPGFRGLPQFIHQQVQDSGYGGVCVCVRDSFSTTIRNPQRFGQSLSFRQSISRGTEMRRRSHVSSRGHPSEQESQK